MSALPKPVLCKKPRAWFKPRKNLREIRRDEAFAELKRSIETYGILQSLIALDNSTLVGGNRRFACAEELGIEEIPVSIFPSSMTEQQIVAVQAVENLHREDLSEIEIWGFCRQLEEGGMPRGEIAQAIGKSPARVTTYLSPAACSPEAKEHFLAGKLTLGQCYRISTSPEPLVTMGLFLRGETHEKAARKPGKAAVAAVRSQKIVCPLVGGPKVMVTAAEISLEEAIEALAEAQKAMKAALAKGLNIKTAQAFWKDVAAAG